MREKLSVSLIFLILLVACSQTKEFPVGSYQPAEVRDDTVRPVINKTTPPNADRQGPPPSQPSTQPTTPNETNVPQLAPPVQEHRLDVGYATLGFNTTLGPHEFSKYEFPELLKSRNVRVGGSTIPYEQFLRVDGGRVIVTANEEDNVSDYLVYEDEEHIMTYEFRLGQGTFLDILDQAILMLGHRYIVREVTKEDVILERAETGTKYVIGPTVRIGDEILEDTEGRMSGSSFIITSKADAEHEGDDLYIAPGETLQDNLGEPTVLTDQFDIEYKGLRDMTTTELRFDNDGEELHVDVQSPSRSARIPLASNEPVRIGDEEGRLVTNENTRVTLQDYLVLSPPGKQSRVFQFSSVNEREQEIELASPDLVTIEARYNASQGRINYAGDQFAFRIENETIRVDMNGNGEFSDDVRYVGDTYTLALPQTVTDGTATYTLRVREQGRSTDHTDITVHFDEELRLTADRDVLESDDHGISVSPYGTYYVFEHEDDGQYEELAVTHPHLQGRAEVVVVSRPRGGRQ
jgi:hypothetical protein